MKKLILIFFLINFFLQGSNPPSIIFKENKGQWPDKVLFGSEFLNTKFYINKTGFNYCVYNFEELENIYGNGNKNSTVHGHNYEVNFVGADLSSFSPKEKLTEYYNYFLGNDRSKWANHISACKFLEFNDVYNGIDIRLYGNSNNLKYDFVISPDSDPGQIKLNYNFVNGIEVRNKQLVIKTSIGEIIEKIPETYQVINEKRINIECEYVINKNSVGFRFPKGYNKNYELVIDPVVIVASYGGSSVLSVANTCNYDVNGNIYTAGYADIGYPTTMGAFQMNGSGGNDIYVSAFNNNGTSKIFSSYVGGSDFEMAIDINVSGKEIILFGIGGSSDYPSTADAFDVTYNGKIDLLLTKLDITGSTLIASTFVGGIDNEDSDEFYEDILSEMDVDKNGNIYIASNTLSSDFPTTPGALSQTLSGVSDAVCFKMDPSLSTMIWSTYLGGNDAENGLNIRCDGKGGVYIAGTTRSKNFPTTSNAYNSVTNDPLYSDIYVSHINASGASLIASTFLGTIIDDEGVLMDIDAANNVYLMGRVSTISPSPTFFIPTAGTYSTQSANCIYKLDSSLSNLGFKTLFGPTGFFKPNLCATAMQIDSCGFIYLAGWTWWGHPTTPNKFYSFAGGGTDMYMMIFNPDCSSIRFASYYGGNANTPTGYNNVGEFGWGKSHFDDKGILYLAVSAPQNFPTTAGAYCTGYNNITTIPRIYNDAFLKVDFQTYVNAYSSYGSNIIACPAPFTANFVNTTNTGTAYWDFGDGNNSSKDTISHVFQSLGTYSIMLVVTDTTTCNRIDSVKSVLSLIPPTTFDLGEDVYLCPNGNLLLKSNVTAASYSWSTGQTNPNINISKPGTYSLTITNNGGCNSSDEITVLSGEDNLVNFPNVITPNGDNVNDLIDFKKFTLEELEFVLFDRWGKEHYRITDVNGSLKPNELKDGTYYYVVTYKSNCSGKHNTAKGYISIFK